ncbi:MAG TPA: DUF4129 domain-containing protein [Gammaproteobacteria bacterium]|nr:DUF4129 domain-containing protein [Gammaproteobacteria bacterium]
MPRRPERTLILLLMLLPASLAFAGARPGPAVIAGRCLSRAAPGRPRVACPGLAGAVARSPLAGLVTVARRGPYPVGLLRDLVAYARDYRPETRGAAPDPAALGPILARLRAPRPPGPPEWLVHLRRWLARRLDWIPWRHGLRWLRRAGGSLHVPVRVVTVLLEVGAAVLLAGGAWLLWRLLRGPGLRPRAHARAPAATGPAGPWRAREPDGGDAPGGWLRDALARLAQSGLIPPPDALSNREVAAAMRSRAPQIAPGFERLARHVDAVSFGGVRLSADERERLHALARSLGEARA